MCPAGETMTRTQGTIITVLVALLVGLTVGWMLGQAFNPQRYDLFVLTDDLFWGLDRKTGDVYTILGGSKVHMGRMTPSEWPKMPGQDSLLFPDGGR